MLFTSLGRSEMGETVPSLSTALGLQPRAVLKTMDTVSRNMDLPTGE